VHADCGSEASVEIRCPRCDRALAAHELSAKLGSGVERPPADREPGSVSAKRLAGARGGVRLGTA
jgi:hypothetical protein